MTRSGKVIEGVWLTPIVEEGAKEVKEDEGVISANDDNDVVVDEGVVRLSAFLRVVIKRKLGVML